MRALIAQVYDVRDFQIVGGPDWSRTDRWDISAKVDGLPPVTNITQLRPLLRALLADRFQLKVHQASKEMPIYNLLVAKGGSKLTENTDKPGPRISMSAGQITANKANVRDLIGLLSRAVGRPVIDETNLTGVYDVTLKWAPNPAPDVQRPGAAPPNDSSADDSPSVFTAVQEQLGLRLESAKGQADVLIVDSVERPSSN